MQPEAGIVPIVQAIKQARTSVSICIFRIDRPEVEKALAAAVQRGVNVSALIAHTNRGGEAAAATSSNSGCWPPASTVSRTGDDLRRYHAKYLVVDNVLHVLGFNLTKLDIDKSRSFAVVHQGSAERAGGAQAVRGRFLAAAVRTGALAIWSSARRPRARRSTRSSAGRNGELSIYDVKVQDPAMVEAAERARRRRAWTCA